MYGNLNFDGDDNPDGDTEQIYKYWTTARPPIP